MTCVESVHWSSGACMTFWWRNTTSCWWKPLNSQTSSFLCWIIIQRGGPPLRSASATHGCSHDSAPKASQRFGWCLQQLNLANFRIYQPQNEMHLQIFFNFRITQRAFWMTLIVSLTLICDFLWGVMLMSILTGARFCTLCCVVCCYTNKSVTVGWLSVWQKLWLQQ